MVGGGTAGSLVENRLSAHSIGISAVVEAGRSALDDPYVTAIQTTVAKLSLRIYIIAQEIEATCIRVFKEDTPRFALSF
jgi:hypothetical protein